MGLLKQLGSIGPQRLRLTPIFIGEEGEKRQPALQKLPIDPLRMLPLGSKLEGVDKCHHSDIYRRQNLAYELFLEERFFLRE